MDIKLIFTVFTAITLIFGLIVPSMNNQSFAQTSDDKQDSIQHQDERLKQFEERKQQAKEDLEKQKQKIEEQREKAKKALEEKQKKVQSSLEEKKQDLKNSMEQKKQKVQDNLEKKRQIAQQKLKEQREKIKNTESDQELKDRAKKIREELQSRRASQNDNETNKQEEIRKKIEQKRDDIKDTASEKSKELQLQILENREDLRNKLLDKKSEILGKLKTQALEKTKLELKNNLRDKVREVTNEKLKQKLELDAREKLSQEISSLKQGLSSLSSTAKDKITSELRDKAQDVLKNNSEILKDDMNKIGVELKNRIEYKSDLIQAKIMEIGKDQFDKLKIEYKEKAKEQAKQKFDEIKSQIKSQGLINQVEDGTYFGIHEEVPERDSINYGFTFDGTALKYQDPSVIKTVSGDVALELISLSDVNAKLQVIGGSFTVLDKTDGTISNVWDVSFGRARILFDNEVMQITINAVDQQGKHGTFRIQATTDGLFPVLYGDPALLISAEKGRASISGEWVLVLSGALAVSEPIPIAEFSDVETEVQEDVITKEISQDITDGMINDIDKSISYILSSDDFSPLTDDERIQIQEELKAELLAQLQLDISNDIQSEVVQSIQGTSN